MRAGVLEKKLSYLFREQCAESGFSENPGSTAKHNGLFSKALTVGTISLIAIIIIALVFWGGYTRKITAKGVLSTRQHTAHATSPASGIVEEVLILEGDSVKSGQYLFKISKESFSSAGSTFSLTFGQINEQIRLAQFKKKAIEFRHSQEILENELKATELSNQIKTIEPEIAAQQRLVDNTREALEKFTLLALEGATSSSARDDVKNDYLNSVVELQKTRQKHNLIAFELKGLPVKIKAMQSAHNISIIELDNDLLLLRRELLNNETSKTAYIVAPTSGTISAINTSIGQNVVASTVLASVSPEDNELQANLYVPPEGIGLIDIGQVANIRISAYPFQKFGMIRGKVSSISQTSYKSSDILMQATEAVDTNKTYYKVIVTIDKQHIEAEGISRALKPGLMVEADLLMDSRRLYEWLLSPIYSFTRKQF